MDVNDGGEDAKDLLICLESTSAPGNTDSQARFAGAGVGYRSPGRLDSLPEGGGTGSSCWMGSK